MYSLPKDKKSFFRGEVDRFVKSMLTQSEFEITELKDKVYELTNRSDKLTKENLELKKSEKDLTRTLTSVSKSLKDLQDITKARQSVSVEHFRQFTFKWANFLKDAFENGTGVNSETIVSDFALDTNEIIEQLNAKLTDENNDKPKSFEHTEKLSSDFSAKDWLNSSSEVEAYKTTKKLKNEELTDELEEQFERIKNAVKSRNVPVENIAPNASGFDFNEALNPTDDLNKILGDLL